jgi:hypothetical protein
MLNEPHSEQYVFEKLSYYEKNNINPSNYMKVIPVPFSTNGAKMLQRAKSLLEDKGNLVAIDKRFDKLLTALRTAVAMEYKVDKEATNYHDILDAMRLSLNPYICSFCNQTLIKLTDAGLNNTTFWCRHCSIEWDPEAENLRKESKIMVPDRNIEPAVTSIQTDQSKSVQIRHEPELQSGFAALAKKGTIKFTSYEEK